MNLGKLENSWIFMIALLVATLFLLLLGAAELGGKLPDLAELKTLPNPSQAAKFSPQIEELFSPDTLKTILPPTNGVSPFFTTRFQPPPPPAKAPDPVPPKSIKQQLTYQGLYQTAAGDKKAFVKVGESTVVGVVGTKIVGDWSVAEIGLRTLILRNSSAQTNILEFNAPKEIEIPNL